MERLSFSPSETYSPTELAIHLARYAPVFPHVKDKKVLDIACGEGYASFCMHRYWGAASVLGLDVDADAIRQARRMFATDGLSYHCADASSWLSSRKAKFEVITCIETIEHLDDPERFLKALNQVLRKDGVLIMTCPNDNWYFGKGQSLNPFHKNVWTFAEFKLLVENIFGPARKWYFGTRCEGFVNVDIQEQKDDWINALNGTFQNRKVLDFVPPKTEAETSESQCLWYSAIWGLTGESASLGSVGAVVPTEPSPKAKRIRGFEIVTRPNFNAAVLLPVDGPEIEVYRSMHTLLDTRLHFEIIPYSTDTILDEVQRLLSMKLSHVRVVGLEAVTAFSRLMLTADVEFLKRTSIAVELSEVESRQLGSDGAFLGLVDLVSQSLVLQDDVTKVAKRFLADIGHAIRNFPLLSAARLAAAKAIAGQKPPAGDTPET